MTVVAVKRHDDHIEFAADSLVVYSGEAKHTKEITKKIFLESAKISKVNDIYLGFAGDLNQGLLLRSFIKSYKFKKTIDEDVILKLFMDFYVWGKKLDDDFKIKNSNIIIYKERIFLMYETAVQEVKDFCAIGCGMHWAISVMDKGGSAAEGVEMATTYDLYCSGKPTIIKIPLKKKK